MKVVHICLSAYIEGSGYQESLLAKHHRLMGYDVYIVARSNDDSHTLHDSEISYINNQGIRVTLLKAIFQDRLSFRKLKSIISLLFGNVIGLYDYLCREKPDVIFLHGCQDVGCKSVVKYVKRNLCVRLFVDQHSDYYNTPVDSIKKKFIAKYIIGRQARNLYKLCETYWGVTPWRVQYLRDVYKLPEGKTKLLVMGGDDEKIDFENKENICLKIRDEYNVGENELLLVTGGKIDSTKNTHLLIEAIKSCPNVKLLVFGKPSPDFSECFESLLKNNSQIINVGWIGADKVYDYFLAADLVVFPGTHSVLWEQAVACGVPCLVKRWPGMEHVNVNGNCSFIDYSSRESSIDILKALKPIITEQKINSMKRCAIECRHDFLYSFIAKKSIGLA